VQPPPLPFVKPQPPEKVTLTIQHFLRPRQVEDQVTIEFQEGAGNGRKIRSVQLNIRPPNRMGQLTVDLPPGVYTVLLSGQSAVLIGQANLRGIGEGKSKVEAVRDMTLQVGIDDSGSVITPQRTMHYRLSLEP